MFTIGFSVPSIFTQYSVPKFTYIFKMTVLLKNRMHFIVYVPHFLYGFDERNCFYFFVNYKWWFNQHRIVDKCLPYWCKLFRCIPRNEHQPQCFLQLRCCPFLQSQHSSLYWTHHQSWLSFSHRNEVMPHHDFICHLPD